jgi:hypothetical protein
MVKFSMVALEDQGVLIASYLHPGGRSRRVKIRAGAGRGGLGPLPRSSGGLCGAAGVLGGMVGAGCP